MNLIKILIQSKKENIYRSKISEKDQTLLSNLEELVYANPDISTEEAMFSVYTKKINSNTFKSLTYRLENKLLNEIFEEIEAEKALDTRFDAKPIVSKYFSIGLALQKSNQKESALIIFEKTLRLSKKYEFTDLALGAAMTFLFYYGFQNPNPKKKLEYELLTQQLNELNTQENILKMYYVSSTQIFINYSGKIPLVKQRMIEGYMHEMNNIYLKHPTYINTLYTFDVNYGYYMMRNDYQSAINMCHEMLSTLYLKKDIDRLLKFTIIKNLGFCQFASGLYNEAKENFIESLNLTIKGSRYWLYSTSMYFMTLINLADYNGAFHLMLEVTALSNKSKWTIYNELWKIREAYVHLLIRAKKILVSDEDKTKLKPFVLTKFLNELPFYSKDKAGQNLNIIVIQMQFLILDRKYNKIIDYKEALEQYIYRYVKKNYYVRSQIFIAMVLQAIKANFHPIHTRRLSQENYEKLIAKSTFIDENEPQFEIIPYNVQWEIILEILDQNYYNS